MRIGQRAADKGVAKQRDDRHRGELADGEGHELEDASSTMTGSIAIAASATG